MMVDGFSPVPAITTEKAPALHSEERTPQQRRASLEAKKAARAAAALPKASSARAVSSSAASLPSSPRHSLASRRQVKSSFLAGEEELRLAESWSPFSSAWESPTAIDQVCLSLSDAPGTLGASRMLLVNCGNCLHLDLLSSAHDLVALADKSPLASTSMFPPKVRRVKAGSYMVPLPCKVQFRKQPTCHMLVDAPSSATNRSVKRCPLPHVLVGFASGDIILYNPWWKLEQARNRSAPKGTIQSISKTLNRGGCIEDSSVTSLQWMPGHEGSRVIVSFLNGSLLVLSLYWDDPQSGKAGRGEAQPPPRHSMLQSLEGLEPACFSAWWAPKGSRVNPMCKIQLSVSPIWQLCFAPDKRTLAAACQDGYLRVLDLEIAKDEAVAAPVIGSLKGEPQQNGLLIAACEVAYRSYYGGFTTVAWSKDMRYLVSGGEDDLVSIWSYPRKELLARGQGHQSWVSSVAVNIRESNKDCLKFASVGLDCRIILWEFSPDICKRPRASSSIHRRPVAPASPQEVATSPERSLAAYPALESSLPLGRRTVPAKQRRQTTALHPFAKHRAGTLPLHGVRHVEGQFITVSIDGEVSVWVPRPRPPAIDLVALLREHSPARTEELPEEVLKGIATADEPAQDSRRTNADPEELAEAQEVNHSSIVEAPQSEVLVNTAVEVGPTLEEKQSDGGLVSLKPCAGEETAEVPDEDLNGSGLVSETSMDVVGLSEECPREQEASLNGEISPLQNGVVSYDGGEAPLHEPEAKGNGVEAAKKESSEGGTLEDCAEHPMFGLGHNGNSCTEEGQQLKKGAEIVKNAEEEEEPPADATDVHTKAEIQAMAVLEENGCER